MYNGFTDSQSKFTPDNEGIDMKLLNVMTNHAFNVYLKERIADAEKSFHFVPGEGLLKDRMEKLGCIRRWLATLLNAEFGKMGIDARINAARIAAGDANKPDAWIDVLRTSGILRRVKANNRLRHYLMQVPDEDNALYYNADGDKTNVHTNKMRNQSAVNFIINQFSFEFPRLLRMGAAFLTENDKAKTNFMLSTSKWTIPTISFIEESDDVMTITIRAGRENGDMERISKQIISALKRMNIVRFYNLVVETPRQHQIMVNLNIKKKEDFVAPEEPIMTPNTVKEIVETPVDASKVIKAKINELEKEFNELEMKKRNLNDEVSRISSRTIQLKRQMETLRISLEVISEPKAGV